MERKYKICINSLKGTCDGSRGIGHPKCHHYEPHNDNTRCGQTSYFTAEDSIPRKIGYICFNKNPRCVEYGTTKLEIYMEEIIKEHERKKDES